MLRPPMDSHASLFDTINVARAAYLRLECRGPQMSDAELARDADYHALFAAGRWIELLGGRDAVVAAAQAFFPQDLGRAARASQCLSHWWAGFGTWRADPATPRTH